MAVKIRLTRTGKKKQPSYRVVVMDSRKPRDGKYIEQIGRYDARQEPSLIEIDNERALVWLHQGAQPTERAQKLLEISGAWAQFRVDRGEIHTVGDHEPAAYPEKLKVVEIIAEESAEATAEEVVEQAVEAEVEAVVEEADEAEVEAVVEEADEAEVEAVVEEAVELVAEAVEAKVEEVVEEVVEEAVEAAAAELVAEAVEEAVEGEEDE
jgi:small subunit ribosomal protein S16